MRIRILLLMTLSVSFSFAFSQQWTGSASTTGDISRTGDVGVGTSTPTAAIHVTGTSINGSPTVDGTQISNRSIEMTVNGGTPYIDFQNDNAGTDYDGRIILTGNDDIKIYGANLSLSDFELREVRGLQLRDWDDDSGGSDNKYRILARDGGFMFYNGGVVIGQYANGTWSDVADGALYVKSSISIGSTSVATGYALSVDGKAMVEEIAVQDATNWPDYVFEDSYELTPLTELEEYISDNKHLPEVPDAKTMETTGVELGETVKILLKKIEELTLYTIQQQKEIEELKTLYSSTLSK